MHVVNQRATGFASDQTARHYRSWRMCVQDLVVVFNDQLAESADRFEIRFRTHIQFEQFVFRIPFAWEQAVFQTGKANIVIELAQ